jgi:hypothetical protein
MTKHHSLLFSRLKVSFQDLSLHSLHTGLQIYVVYIFKAYILHQKEYLFLKEHVKRTHYHVC